MNMTTLTQLPSTGFLRLHQVLEYYPVSRSTWWAGVKSGRYPQSVKLGPRMTAWKAEDIRALIESQNFNKG
ncbi:helix-turn-helix transcriptional regulator [Methylobacillus glycogenes]|uniref:helix-turn-helix transcriptional regulator n=1 Tax=Methylobacillus glycogenes TaxID=406 RepID=UPI0034E1A102